DIARTDFFGQEKKAEMAATIHDSIFKKILPLGKGAILCPAHGAGSVCGGDIADLPISTIGFEERTNPQLLITKEEFVAKRITESPYQPPYFRQMERLNRDGPALLGTVPAPRPLQPAEVQEIIRSGCQLVDIRSPTAFAGGHIPGSMSIWREGLPAFAGWVLDYSRPIVVIDDFNCEVPRALLHFVRLGFDTVSGWLAGGFPAWFRAALPVETTGTCTVQELFQKQREKDLFLLDVRDIKKRMAQGHIQGSHHIYAGEIPVRIGEIPRDRPVYVYCDAGYKGSLAVSLLAMRGYDKVTNVLGGMQAWLRAGFPAEHS
ncbi:MAG: rhodanese-like domain-containing protein, partial [Methanoregula sp.]